jgi:hypothetical protein
LARRSTNNDVHLTAPHPCRSQHLLRSNLLDSAAEETRFLMSGSESMARRFIVILSSKDVEAGLAEAF